MQRKTNTLNLAVALFLVSPLAAVAQSIPALVGRLPCINYASTLRHGSFRLPVGPVRLRDSKACVKPYPAYQGCEWGVELTRASGSWH